MLGFMEKKPLNNLRDQTPAKRGPGGLLDSDDQPLYSSPHFKNECRNHRHEISSCRQLATFLLGKNEGKAMIGILEGGIPPTFGII